MKTKDILEAVRSKLDIEELKPMQEEMLGIDANNVELCAPTGSGKTLAFSLYVLRKLQDGKEGVKVLVVVPSRELALQVGEILRRIAVGYKTVVLYGGHRMEEEEKSLRPIPDIVIATPGRLLDHLERGNLEIKNLKSLVLDEYDKSLELGFEKEMKSIGRKIGKPESVVLTSATLLSENLPDWLGERKFTILNFNKESQPIIEKIHIESPAKDKAETLTDLLFALPKGRKTIVFVNHRESADRLVKFLRENKIEAALYHGALDQHERETALYLFENGSSPVLVSTDLAGRGLDIKDVESVVHYHLPPTQENWIHRNGRTARNGNRGSVYIITCEGETIPDYVNWDREWYPPRHDKDASVSSPIVTLHINAGRKEKISKGDIVGYLIKNGGLKSSDIGVIKLMDHESLVGVPKESAKRITELSNIYKLKNKKVKITRIRQKT